MRSSQVIKLFFKIFWSFYSLNLYKIWHTESWLQHRKQELYASQARYFRLTAIALGGLLIKLGQFFSTRVDLLPRACIDELAKLQDEVPPVDFPEIKKTAESELGKPLEHVYSSFESTPLAAASLGQVHQAVLASGRQVAVKVLRPGIEGLVRIDLASIRRVISFIQKFTDWSRFINFEAIYHEFSQTVWEELDYIHEGQNAELMARNRAGDKDLIIPQIFWDCTTRRVLTMEYMEGFKITDYSALEQAEIDRRAFARLLLKTYIEQILLDGFFHADPHPGNLFVTPQGKLVLIDFGMTGRIPSQLRDSLIAMVLAMVKRDHLSVAAYLKKLGFLRNDAESETVGRAVGAVLENMLGVKQELTDYDLFLLLQDIERLVYEQPFQIPANFTFLGRALATVYGLCVGLDPQISFLDEAKPYLKELTRDQAGLWKSLRDKGTALASSLVELPALTEAVLRRLDRGEITVKMTSPDLIHAIERNTQAIHSLSWMGMAAFILFTSSYLLVNRLVIPAKCGFALDALLVIIWLFKRRRANKVRKAPHPPFLIRKSEDN
jgi:predicted unusual protein kinase regulating ubiquinone biosynthesis (AarF/ABC1/UbiB family)